MSKVRTGRFWLISASALAGVGVTLALGAWQMGRASEKLALHAAIEQRRNMPPIDGASVIAGPAAQLVHRPVMLRGTWVPRATVFLDNRQMDGKPGFYVVTPLQLAGSSASVLVERGWVQRNFSDREKLPPIPTPQGLVEVAGRLAPPPAKLYEFAGAGTGAIRQNLDLAQFRAETGLALLEVAVQQSGPPSEGLLRNWPEPASGVEKNYGYAFQWWALSGLIAFLYVWFQFIVPRRQRSRA